MPDDAPELTRPAGSRPTTSRPRSRCSAPCCCPATPSPRPSRSAGADDFYKPAHGHVFDAVSLARTRQGEPADPVTVADELRRADLLDAIGGPATLITLQANTPATTNAGRYARIVEEHALLRRLIGVAGEIAEMGYGLPDDVDEAVDRAESLVFEVAERRVTDTLTPLHDLLDARASTASRRSTSGASRSPACPTGFIDLDERLSGLQPSSLIIVGARPAMGKTALRPGHGRPRRHRGRACRCCSSRWR